MTKRPCWVEIDQKAVADNFRFLQTLVAQDVEILAMIKANAYGHGLAECVPPLLAAGARWLGVTSVDEGIELRALAPEARILAASGLFFGQAEAAIAARITVSAWEEWQLAELHQAALKANLPPASLPVHLEIDTGMSRQGVSPQMLASEGGRDLLRHFAASSPLRLEGVMSHLYGADEADGQANQHQLNELRLAVQALNNAGIYADWLTVGASAALLAGTGNQIQNLAASFGMRAMLRPGLALFGIVPPFAPDFAEGAKPLSLLASLANLRPVLAWKTRVVALRQIPAGASIGYNGTFVASEPMRLALIPAGYADGVDRHLGNNFSLLVHGERAPLVGRVSMDQSILDVTDIEGVQVGDEVVILGQQGTATLTAQEHANATGTISWEVFTRIGHRVYRTAI